MLSSSPVHRDQVTHETAIRLQRQSEITIQALHGRLTNGQTNVPTSWSYQVLIGTRCRMDIQECQSVKCEKQQGVRYLMLLLSFSAPCEHKSLVRNV